jgi:hypothetical protein
VWAAPPEKRAAVVDVVTEGLAPAARDRLDDALVEGLRFTGYVVVPRRSVRDNAAKANFPEGCAFGPCLAQIGRALDVGRALVARVVADGQAYSFVLTLVETRAGTPVGQVVDSCAPCNVDEALDKISSSMVALGEAATAAALKKVAFPVARREGGIAWAGPWLSAAGVAACVVGAVLVAKTDQRDGGFVTIGAGSALLATGIFVWVLD